MSDADIRFVFSPEGLAPDALQGFFVGWGNPPAPETHLRLLQNSAEVVLAVEARSGRVIGFITAITDRVLSAYIPLLEVLPEYQGRGIGRELTVKMLERLRELYMIDLLCDAELQPFYAKLGLSRATGMMRRNYDRQSGRIPPDEAPAA